MSLHGARIHIGGIVQGVGFRPFVYGLARRLDLSGWVRNTSAGVDIEVDGPEQVLLDFIQRLKQEAPALARIDELQVTWQAANGFSDFVIIHSEPVAGAFQPISPDVCICPDCLRELLDPTDRRYRYPFINCTNCGPRLTIIQDIPYDRPNTTMAGFPLCAACAAEYQDPLDRRFHAQPVACAACGPEVWLEDLTHPPSPLLSPKGREALTLPPSPLLSPKGQEALTHPPSPLLSPGGREKGEVKRDEGISGDSAILEARELLRQGKILAIKGLGGFHLACDATNPQAVAELRRRKQRVDKPFALMAPTMELIRAHCLVSPAEAELLQQRERPIVILGRKPGTSIAAECAPGQNTLGVMLPYTPLHYLLFANPEIPGDFDMPPLVMTSGNLSEEPICTDNEDARQRLGELADAFLMHNRPIHVRCDDSVVRMFPAFKNELVKGEKSTLYPLRRARGYAPNPLYLPVEAPPLLASGAELKNTFCLARERYAFLSQHVGDLENYETLRSFEDGIAHYERLFRIQPEVIAYDLHPDYLATRYALERAGRENLPALGVQHHHAHIAACMAEHGLSGERPLIGIAFDGTGYGDDGAIWGGEFLLATYQNYERLAHLRYTPLPGGDAAARQPWRMALSWLHSAGIDWQDDLPPVQYAAANPGPLNQLDLLQRMLHSALNAPATSSMGRLFDAAAALIGLRQVINFEAQAAIELEVSVERRETQYYPFDVQEDTLDPTPLWLALLEDLRAGVPAGVMAARFHGGVAQAVLEMCTRLRKRTGVSEVALSGGVWQNIHLLAITVGLLQAADFTIYLHRLVPANDGGLALGQAAVAIARYN